jgi:hypothetical protein
LAPSSRSIRKFKLKEIWVNDFDGCDPSGAGDSFPAFQAAVNEASQLPYGGVVRVRSGQYNIVGGTVTNDRSSDNTRQRVSIVGDDQNGVRIYFSGSGSSCFSFIGKDNPQEEGNASHQMISDMTLISATRKENSSGIYGSLLSFLRIERVNIQNFDYGLYLQDVDQFSADNLMLRFNNKGGLVRKNPNSYASSTQPNNHTWKACTIANNRDYGFIWIGGASINIYGGDVEYNGSGGSNFGLKFLDCGYEGAKGANIIGTYFEGNYGVADVYIEATAINSYPILSCVHYISADFKRINSIHNSNQHIAMVVGEENTVGHQKLVTVGCGFKEYLGYTPSGYTPKIAFLGIPANPHNFHDFGSLWGSPAELPPFVQEINKVDAVICKQQNQYINPNTMSKWLLDTIVEPAPIWRPIISGGDVRIDKTGTYNFSVFVVFSSSLMGRKGLYITRNGNIVGSGESTGTSDVCSLNATFRVSSGDSIGILINQETPYGLIILGASSAYSNLTITRVYN